MSANPVRVLGIQWAHIVRMPAPWGDYIGCRMFEPELCPTISEPRVLVERGPVVSALRLVGGDGRVWYQHLVHTVDMDESLVRPVL